MKIHHLNCGILHVPPNPKASCHCLLLERKGGQLVLIDTGIGLLDIASPIERIGKLAVEAAGFQFHEELTAIRQIEELGFHANDVTDIILTHADHDHVGGLSDFPAARVHISAEEHSGVIDGCSRYSSLQFSHNPDWITYKSSTVRWFGLEARPVKIFDDVAIYLIPLFGHTFGHCGVAIERSEGWLLHIGDAYYLRAELADDEHPISALAQVAAQDDSLRRESLSSLRRLSSAHGGEVDMLGYHDFGEIP